MFQDFQDPRYANTLTESALQSPSLTSWDSESGSSCLYLYLFDLLWHSTALVCLCVIMWPDPRVSHFIATCPSAVASSPFLEIQHAGREHILCWDDLLWLQMVAAASERLYKNDQIYYCLLDCTGILWFVTVVSVIASFWGEILHECPFQIDLLLDIG